MSTAVVALGLTVGPAAIRTAKVDAYERATSNASIVAGAANSTIQSSGLDVQYSTSGLTHIDSTTTLGSRGFVASDFTPGLQSSAPAVMFDTDAVNNCAATGDCSGLGTVAINFGQPIRNPVVHLAGLGGNIFNELPNGTVTASSQLHVSLSVVTPGVTLSKLSGGNLQVVDGTTITAANSSTGLNCNNTANGSNPLPAQDSAVCGSVQVVGTVSALTFDISAVFTQTQAGTPAHTINDTNANRYNEDFWILTTTVPEDFGDAPISYDQGNAARAVPSDVVLGAQTTEDNAAVLDATTSPNASANAGLDNGDDGATLGPITNDATSYSTTVTLSGASKAGTVCGWIDFNRNGTFDNAERACSTFTPGATAGTLNWTGLSDLSAGTTYARFRVGYNAAQTQAPTGASDAGEVEDYQLAITLAPGFSCSTGTVFITQGAPGAPSQLYVAESDGSGGITFNTVGPTMPMEVNALAWREVDGYLYAMNADSGNRTDLIRIGPGGVTANLGPVAGLPGPGLQHYNQGTFGDGAFADTYFVRVSAPTNVLHAIDVDTLTNTPITLNASVPNTDDFVWKDGFIWSVSNGTTMYRINPADGEVASWSLASLGMTVGVYGGQWVYGNGNIGISHNGAGLVYQIAVTNPGAATPTFTLVATASGPSAGRNDGTACPGADVDLAITKDGPATYSAGGTLAYTLTVTNHGPGVSSGSVVSDTLPAALANAATSTPQCQFAGQQLTCVLGTLAVGDTFTIHIAADVIAGTSGTITNTTTVVGNERDPDPTNDTDDTQADPSQVPASCNTLWYVTNAPIGDPRPGTYGFVDPTSGQWTHVGTLSSQSSATAISAGGSTMWYAGWNPAAASPNGLLYGLDLATGVSAQLNATPHNMFLNNRMAVAPNGRLYTMSSNGNLWYTNPTSTSIGSPVNLGSTGVPSNGLTGGDMAFDGLGNLYIIASNSNLYVVPADSIAAGNPTAAFVGTMSGAHNFPGLAFTEDGNAYAATGGNDARLMNVDIATGDDTQVAQTATDFVGDLGSCAFPDPELETAKAVSPTSAVKPGDTLTYTITATNGGVVESTNTVLSDQIPPNTTYVAGSTTLNGASVGDENGAMPYVNGSPIRTPGAFNGVIAPNGTATVTFQVVVNDPFPADATKVVNQAAVESSGIPLIPTNPVETPVLDPGLELVKTADRGQASNAGDVIKYTFTATNTGNTTLSDVAIVDDPAQFTGTGTLSPMVCSPTTQPATLAPGDQLICTATYEVTQADMDAKSIFNSATACAINGNNGNNGNGNGNNGNRKGSRATPNFDNNGPPRSFAAQANRVCDGDSVTVPSPDKPKLSMDKRVAKIVDANDNDLVDLDDEIWYEFELRNNGNVTLTGVAVNDGLLTSVGVAVTCPSAILMPGKSMLCSAIGPYRIGRKDIRSGWVINSATATAVCRPVSNAHRPAGTKNLSGCQKVESPPDATKTPLQQVGQTGGGEGLADTGAPAWLLTAGISGLLSVGLGLYLMTVPGRQRNRGRR
jgi:uncharacterized repeat protein (TIGR01451 family)